MSITSKYNFKVSVDQFGKKVNPNWYDSTEILLINKFEELILSLPNKINYNMIELGSNQSYYSLLFKSILGKNRTFNIMLEPYDPHYNRGVKEFELNDYSGIFINKGIGEKCQIHNRIFEKPTTSIDEILDEYKLNDVDCLMCDIDGAEFLMLLGAKKTLKEKKITYMFIATHFDVLFHNKIIEEMKKYDYELILNEPNKVVGADSLLIYKRKL
jgi:hypothetical protein